MSTLQRQNTLFVSEDWVRIYEAIQNVEFRAYDFDNLVSAILNHLRDVFPEEFNDWIASSEFIMKVEVLAWLSQNIAFRIDLNTRENFLATAERRDSLIRLAQNVSYKIARVRGARGQVRIESVRTNQALFDSNNISLQDREINWNDPRNEDWFEQFILIMNAAFASRTQFGRPLAKFQDGNTRTEQYVFNGQAPSTGVFPFSASVNGVDLPFEVINARLDKDTGEFEEFSPAPDNAFNCFYVSDGRGLASTGTGFFYQFRQGTLQFQDEDFVEPETIRILDIGTQNVNNDDFFVQELDSTGELDETWQQVDTVFGESVSFLPTNETANLDTTTGQQATGDARKVYEVDTLENDRVRVRFGDGTFGEIPTGRFRFWYRTSNPQPQVVNPTDIGRQSFTLSYVVDGTVFLLTMTVALKDPVINAATSETNFSIRTRANQVFYSQNRMITGRDYNSFFLRDNAIRKVKTVNRTFSGHSRFTKLHDPTGLYENLKVFAEDGRFYQERVRSVFFTSADITVQSNPLLIQNVIEPLLEEADKEQLYFNDYPEQFFPTNHFWFEDSVVNQQSRGRITTTQGDASGAIKVGTATLSEPARFVLVDSVLRLDNPRGSTVRVDRIIDDGDIADGIILERDIPADIRVTSVFPPFRKKFLDGEKTLIEQQLELKLDFGLSWHQDTQTWEVITFDNLDKQEPSGMFCLDNQGDTSGTNLDQSWMIYLEFTPGGSPEDDTWKVVHRGIGIFFESARENDFWFANDEPVLDPDTGRVERDRILISECNESRDSLRRRGLNNLDLAGLLECDIFCYRFVGDGTTVKFTTQENPLNPEAVVSVDGALQIFGVDYTIESKVSGDSVIFNVAPPDGSDVLICISLNNSLKSVKTEVAGPFQGDGVDFEFDLGFVTVDPLNTFVFIDGVLQQALVDYGVTTLLNGNAAISLAAPLPAGAFLYVYFLPDITNALFSHSHFIGDGVDDSYGISETNQTTDTILTGWDGVIQEPDSYTISPVGATTTSVTYTAAPGLSVKITIISNKDSNFARTNMYDFGPADGIQNTFTLTNQANAEAETTIVFFDGIMQEGPWGTSPVWTISSSNNVFFSTPPAAGVEVVIFSILGGVGNDPDSQQGATGLGSGGGGTVGEGSGFNGLPLGTNNLGNTSVTSLLVQYLGTDVPLFVEDALRHPDGYVNENGVEVTSADLDNSGFADNIFVFKDVVLQDGFTDLVLWRKINEFGFTVFDPINLQTRPRGSYGLSTQSDVAAGTVIDNSGFATGIPLQVLRSLPENEFTVLEGDIHYDISTTTWLVADVEVTGTWLAAPDQTLFKFEIGRDHLKFLWVHFAPDEFRIDPSVSNIMDSYVLTTAYDDQFRTALSNNVATEFLPAAPTPEALRVQFADFDNFKAMSDSIIYHPARYKPLFGQQAIPELQATFKVIQAEGSLLSENDLKIRILEIIDLFFSVDNFEFGETFYMTELLAFIHQEMAPNVQSVVAVPKDDDEAFGRLFQIRSEPDELFISAASSEDIEVVNSFTDEELRIGVIS